MLYFAYGSNMDKDDLDEWCRNRGCSTVRFSSVSPARLNGYKLVFNYCSVTRGGGAANIVEAKCDCVYGLLMEMKEDDLNTIRCKEGYFPNISKRYYEEIRVDVEKFDGTKVSDVVTYKVVREREKPDHQPPTGEYLGLLIRNAEEYRFPRDYINYLKAILTKD